jgi:predicted dehydrogenase
MKPVTRHRILIVGTGSIGTRHVRCMVNTGRAEVGICEPNAQLRQSVASTYTIDQAYANLDQALETSWDAAVIATPAPSHIPVAQRLADAGVGVLIEKPLAVEEDGIAHLAATIEQNELPAAVAYVYRAHPAVQAMREAIQSERFGRPLHLIVMSGQPFWHLRPAYRNIYYADRAQGGGGIQDGLTHSFNLCEWLLGPITRIAVDAAHLRLDGVSVEDTVNVLARHDESVLASYAFNQHQAPNESSITVVCSEGTLRLETRRHRWLWMNEPCGAWQEQAFELPNQDDWFIRQEHAFLDHVEGNHPPLCSLADGWQTLRVNRAALSSMDDGGAWRDVAAIQRQGLKQANALRSTVIPGV